MSETVLQEAQRLVYGDREKAYSHPARDYGKTAGMWSAFLREKLKPGVTITPHEATLMMALMKISREGFQHKRDNLVDGAGYLECANRIEEVQEENLKILNDLIEDSQSNVFARVLAKEKKGSRPPTPLSHAFSAILAGFVDEEGKRVTNAGRK